MNIDQQLKLQSFLDGELSPRESQEVTAWLAKDADARALLTELKNTSTALTGNELEIKLPESREFFFSKIQRQIEREEQAPAPQRVTFQEPFLARLRRYFLPLAGAAVAAIVFTMVSTNDNGGLTAYTPGEGETSSDMAAYTYRSQSDKMTVVWLADNSSAVEDSSEATEIQ